MMLRAFCRQFHSAPSTTGRSSGPAVRRSLPAWLAAVDPAILRDLDQCPASWNEDTYQRRNGRFVLPAAEACRVTDYVESHDGKTFSVEWSDGHVSSYRAAWIREMLSPSQPRQQVWEAGDIQARGALPRADYSSLFTRDGVRAWTDLVCSLGFAIVENVPCSKQAGDAVGLLLGVKDHREMYGRETFVRIEPGSWNDSAFSGEELLPHTDGNYLQSQPHLQLFHCWIADAGGGGITGVLDGFAVAEELRRTAPEAFRVLTTHEVTFHYHDKVSSHFMRRTVLGIDSSGQLTRVSWNNLDRAALPANRELRFALQEWDRLLYDFTDRWEVRFQLQPGEFLALDNRRVMHARWGQMMPTSKRLLYQYYMHCDGLWGSHRLPRKLVLAAESRQEEEQECVNERGEVPAPSPHTPAKKSGTHIPLLVQSPSPLRPITVQSFSTDESVQRIIDFRSDTCTQPSAKMREAIAAAEVGDDCWGECPMTKQVEDMAASLLGREAGLWVCDETQGNLLGMAALAGPRSGQVLCGKKSHIFRNDAMGASVLFGLPLEPVDDLANLESVSLDTDTGHVHPPALIAAENTIGALAGQVVDPAELTRLASLGLPLHLDGARLFNAAVAIGLDDVAQASAGATTVQLCMSRSLGCPGGSVLVGPAPVIHRARELRKMLGGGSRQGHGLLAAAAMTLLRDPQQMYDQLRADHIGMAGVIDRLQQIGVTVDAYGGTNIGIFSVPKSRANQQALQSIKKAGIRIDVREARVSSEAPVLRWRMVVHKDISPALLQYALNIFSDELSHLG